jgi:hypothetical protein
MTRYRYYLLDLDKRVRESEAMECASDAEAFVISLEILKRRPEFYGIELWEGTRCVEKIDRSSL